MSTPNTTTINGVDVTALAREYGVECGYESDEIVTTEDGEKCIDCIEEEKFYQETMRGL